MSRSRTHLPISHQDAREQVAAVLYGCARDQIVNALHGSSSSERVLDRLRRALRSHTFPCGSGRFVLRPIVDSLDARSRAEGIHILHPWDHARQEHPREMGPVLMADFCGRLNLPPERERAVVALLLDHYLLTVLSLLAVRVWDNGDPDQNLDALSQLIELLHGPEGSGLRIVDDAETLLLLAVSYYHPAEESYSRLLRKVQTLDRSHLLQVALPSAAMLGSHLRWGLRFMYQRDLVRMRADNVVDYPWLLFSILTSMREYARLREAGTDVSQREPVVAALLNGLSADPWAFRDQPPTALADMRVEHSEFRELFSRYHFDLLHEFSRQRPAPASYSPLGFACNFPLNAVVGTVACTLIDDAPQPSLNALFSRAHSGGSPAETYARRLTTFALGSRERLDATGAPLIVYDPYDGAQHYNLVVHTLQYPMQPMRPAS
ncbi:MAG: hypothetical protein WEE89_19320 [Gemmatimonadota bacterium]